MTEREEGRGGVEAGKTARERARRLGQGATGAAPPPRKRLLSESDAGATRSRVTRAHLALTFAGGGARAPRAAQGVRDVPQTVEGKAAQARDRRRLPGVRVESWNGWPTLHRALGPALAMSAGQCCSTFMHMSDEE